MLLRILSKTTANFLSQTFSKGKHLLKKCGRAKTNHKTKYATVAQLVEQLIRNQQVGGSSPPSSSKKRLSFFSITSFFELFFTARFYNY